MIIGKPKQSSRDNILDLFIEVCVSIYLYILIALTDYMGPDNSFRDQEGWALVILVLIVLAINIVNLGFSVGKSFLKWFKKKCLQKTKVEKDYDKASIYVQQ